MTSRTEYHGRKSGRSWRVASSALALGITLLWAAVAVRAQEAPAYTVLYTFTGADGANPQAALIRDGNGNLYGTTFSGGDLNKCGGAGCGVVFGLDRSGVETVLYRFEAGVDGAGPAADLLRDEAGNLYSTTHGGGDVSGCHLEVGVPWSGCGVVFKVDRTTGKETTLYAFTGSKDGGGPSSGVIRDRAGNLYGTTVFGGGKACSFFGMPGCGVVYKLDPAGKETVLHSFTGGADGLAPYGDLLLSWAGNLFGIGGNGGDTTSTFCGETVLKLTGLAGCGTVFKIDPAGGFTVLHTFHGTDGGPFPDGWLVRDHRGNIYGMTGNGGILSDCSGLGCGVVFRLDRNGKETVLHSFTGGADGAVTSASVVRDRAGNLYGTTSSGGDVSHTPCAGVGGCGVVFKLDPAGKETVLHTFTGGADGANPSANLLLGKDGNLYGTAQDGGEAGCSAPGTPLPGCGVVFKITLHR
jgi:uncharacterized repeat protein (TIGR03803 family)